MVNTHLKNTLAVLALFSITSCSVRKATVLEDHSSSSQSTEILEYRGQVDTVITFAPTPFEASVTIESLHAAPDNTMVFNSPAGSIQVSLKDNRIDITATPDTARKEVILKPEVKKQTIKKDQQSWDRFESIKKSQPVIFWISFGFMAICIIAIIIVIIRSLYKLKP